MPRIQLKAWYDQENPQEGPVDMTILIRTDKVSFIAAFVATRNRLDKDVELAKTTLIEFLNEPLDIEDLQEHLHVWDGGNEPLFTMTIGCRPIGDDTTLKEMVGDLLEKIPELSL